MFRRRRNDQSEAVEVDEGLEATEATEAAEEGDGAEAGGEELTPVVAGPVYDRSQGPYDLDEVPDDGLARLDLGGMRVPGIEGMELRLDLDESGQTVVAATVVLADSALQLMAFAAPRTEGIWDDVRGEIRGNLAAQGPVEEATGVFGRELLATLPVTGPQGQSGLQPVRFVGVDGPRWFLRGLFSGPAARTAAQAEALEAVLRATVVVRGTDPMAPGDLLPLRVPEAGEGLTPEEPDQPGRPGLKPPERGPEITEIR